MSRPSFWKTTRYLILSTSAQTPMSERPLWLHFPALGHCAFSGQSLAPCGCERSRTSQPNEGLGRDAYVARGVWRIPHLFARFAGPRRWGLAPARSDAGRRLGNNQGSTLAGRIATGLASIMPRQCSVNSAKNSKAVYPLIRRSIQALSKGHSPSELGAAADWWTPLFTGGTTSVRATGGSKAQRQLAKDEEPGFQT
jgi:hypothetical protein